MTPFVQKGRTSVTAVIVAVLALILGMASTPASAGLVTPPIHSTSAGFNDVDALRAPTAGQLTSIDSGGAMTDGKLLVRLRNGNTAEVRIDSLSALPNGQFSGVADIFVRDGAGNVIDSTRDLTLRGSIRFFEIWNRVYDVNDATLAGDGMLTRRMQHSLLLIGSGGGAIFILNAHIRDTVNSRLTPATTFEGTLLIVAPGMDGGVGRADVVSTGCRDGRADFFINDGNFESFVGSILWRSAVTVTVPFQATPISNGSLLLLTIWYNERANQPGQYLFLYQARYGGFNRYRELLIQTGRNLGRQSVEGNELLAKNFSNFRTKLRDTFFIGISSSAITIISSRRTAAFIM